MKLEIYQQFFEKYSNIKFRENPSSGSRVVPCGRTDMTKLIVAFRNFTNAPKNMAAGWRPMSPTKVPETTSKSGFRLRDIVAMVGAEPRSGCAAPFVLIALYCDF